MLHVAIEDSDQFYRKGMEVFLEKLFLDEQNESVQFNSLTKLNVTHFDIIVKSFVAGSEFICHPILKYRSKTGLIIGVYDGDKSPYHDTLPLCIKNILFINRCEPLNTARVKVIEAWNESLKISKKLLCIKCLQCTYRMLTQQQLTIAKHLLTGRSIGDIAELMKLNIKTVSAHKRLMMSKFDLKSDCELLNFLNNLKKDNPPAYLFTNKNL